MKKFILFNIINTGEKRKAGIMNKDFEKRYKKLLIEAENGSLVMLFAVESKGGYLCKIQPFVISREEIYVFYYVNVS